MADARSNRIPAEVLSLWPDHKTAGTGKPEDDFQPILDCYPLTDGKCHPAIVICPGGAYAFRAPHEGVDVAQRFNELGFHAFVVQYRVAPYRYPAPQMDAFRAIRLVRANAARWHVRKDQVAICGFSAGGHLCASTGVLFHDLDACAGDAADAESQRPDALVLGYPVITFGPLGHRGSGENLLGTRFDELQSLMSLENRVLPDTPPVFLWHTVTDGAVPVENSMMFVARLRGLRVPFALHLFAEGNHGLGLAPDFADIAKWPELARDFLAVNLKFEV